MTVFRKCLGALRLHGNSLLRHIGLIHPTGPMLPPSASLGPVRRRIPLAILVLALLFGSCAHQEIAWTPKTVAPPASLDSALEQIQVPQASAAIPEESQVPGETPAVSVDTGIVPANAVSLTRDGAILAALQRNRSLAVERFGPGIAATSVQEARAAFDPRFQTSVSYGENKSPVSTALTAAASGNIPGGVDDDASLLEILSALDQQISTIDQTIEAYGARRTNITGSLDTTARISEYLPTGTELFLAGGYGRNSSTLADDNAYSGVWSIGVTQALLQGLGTGVNLATLRQSRNSAAASDQALRAAALDLVRDVELAYWNLVLAEETLEIRQFSVQLSEELLRMNRALIDVGKIAESEQISAEAALAASKADLVDAEAAVRTRTIDLWRLLNPQSTSADEIAYSPADAPEVVAIELDPRTSIELAKRFRPELAQARLSLANRQLEIVRTRNGLLPRLDFFATYGRSSEGTNPQAGIRYLDSRDYDNFQVGLSFETSVTYRAERAAHRRAKFQAKQAQAAVANLEQLIEAQVQQAAVETTRQWERIQATAKEVQSREEELRVEQDMFRLGRATNLDVLQVQEGLIRAKVDAASARVGYIEALTALFHTEGTLLERRGVSVDTGEETSS